MQIGARQVNCVCSNDFRPSTTSARTGFISMPNNYYISLVLSAAARDLNRFESMVQPSQVHAATPSKPKSEAKSPLKLRKNCVPIVPVFANQSEQMRLHNCTVRCGRENREGKRLSGKSISTSWCFRIRHGTSSRSMAVFSVSPKCTASAGSG